MKARTIVLVALLTFLVAAILAVGRLVWKRPLAVYAWSNRLAPSQLGLDKVKVDSPAGTQTAFVGGAGPVLVLLHGAGDQAGTWSKVVAELVKTHRLVIPDLAGHGASAPRRGPIEVAAILAGVEACIEGQAAGGKLTLAGNSLGGWIAMLVAHRHPEWVERVVAIDGGAIKGENRQAIVLPRTRVEARAAMGQVRDPGSPRVPDFVLDDVVREASSGALARFAATAGTMESFLLDGRLGEVKVPVELLWGESDRLVPLDYARRMLAELPAARLTVIPKCGHVPQQECPEKFLAALRGALGNLP
ncbi:MAG: alpha/beta hydrolase [Acidobacteriota bacterium]